MTTSHGSGSSVIFGAGPMACADSFDQLAIPPVGADPYDGTMRHAENAGREGTMMEQGEGTMIVWYTDP